MLLLKMLGSLSMMLGLSLVFFNVAMMIVDGGVSGVAFDLVSMVVVDRYDLLGLLLMNHETLGCADS